MVPQVLFLIPMIRTAFVLAFLLLVSLGHSQTGCPGCQVQLPTQLVQDTFYLDTLVAAQKNAPYDCTVALRLPLSSDDLPNALPGLPVTRASLSEVRGLPKGLKWDANQNLWQIMGLEQDGCIRFCGTASSTGVYPVTFVFNFEVDDQWNVRLEVIRPLVVLPETRENAGFSMTNGSDCDSAVVSFKNLHPSVGLPGFSYLWDFGNGVISSEENPGIQRYTTPGAYPVTYNAIIDTAQYYLTKVTVLSTSCLDLPTLSNPNTLPDLHIDIWNEWNNVQFVYGPIYFDTQLPLSESFFYKIGEPFFVVRIVDEDSGINGADDLCGTFKIPRDAPGTYSNNGTTIKVEIYHPIDTISVTDTVFIYGPPVAPEIALQDSSLALCDGNAVFLKTDAPAGTLWKYNNETTGVVNGNPLKADAAGFYWLEYTDEYGCTSLSDSVQVHPLPAPPVVTDSRAGQPHCEGLLTRLTANYTSGLQWHRNDQAMFGQVTQILQTSAAGAYTVRYTDANGCISWSAPITIHKNPVAPIITDNANGEPRCEGKTLNMVSNVTTGLQWIQDGLPLVGETSPVYTASFAGNYTVVHTDANGCSSTSNALTVHPNPPKPALIDLMANNDPCDGDTAVLESNSAWPLTWFLNNQSIAVSGNTYVTKSSGIYKVVSTDANGCTAVSNPVQVLNSIALPVPQFVNIRNLLEWKDTMVLPQVYRLQWYYNGVPVAGATGFTICARISGNYELRLYDDITLCEQRYAADVVVNPEFDCFTSAYDLRQYAWKAYPNPFSGTVFLENLPQGALLRIYDIRGQMVFQQIHDSGGNQQLTLSQLMPGWYWFMVNAEGLPLIKTE